MTDLLDVGLWIVQALLAVAFLLAGVMHAFRYEAAKKNLPWVKDLPRGVVRLDGAVEILGAVGVILPRLTGILPVLTPLAAAGLALIMAVAITLHVRRKESRAIGVTGLLFLMAAFVAYGRWFLVP
ncbi:MAG TPA: DoxX family protein [Thermoplasmata archaeon]